MSRFTLGKLGTLAGDGTLRRRLRLQGIAPQKQLDEAHRLGGDSVELSGIIRDNLRVASDVRLEGGGYTMRDSNARTAVVALDQSRPAIDAAGSENYEILSIGAVGGPYALRLGTGGGGANVKLDVQASWASVSCVFVEGAIERIRRDSYLRTIGGPTGFMVSWNGAAPGAGVDSFLDKTSLSLESHFHSGVAWVIDSRVSRRLSLRDCMCHGNGPFNGQTSGPTLRLTGDHLAFTIDGLYTEYICNRAPGQEDDLFLGANGWGSPRSVTIKDAFLGGPDVDGTSFPRASLRIDAAGRHRNGNIPIVVYGGHRYSIFDVGDAKGPLCRIDSGGAYKQHGSRLAPHEIADSMPATVVANADTPRGMDEAAKHARALATWKAVDGQRRRLFAAPRR